MKQILLLVSLLLVIALVIFKNRKLTKSKCENMNLTFDNDFELVVIDKYKYDEYLHLKKNIIKIDSSIIDLKNNLNKDFEINNELKEYLVRTNKSIQNYDYKSDIEMYKSIAKTNLDNFNKDKSYYLSAINEYLFFYKCLDNNQSWFFLRQPTMLSLEFYTHFCPHFYQDYLEQSFDYEYNFKSIETISQNKIDELQLSYGETVDITLHPFFKIDIEKLKLLNEEIVKNESKLKDYPIHLDEYNFLKSVLAESINGGKIVLVR